MSKTQEERLSLESNEEDAKLQQNRRGGLKLNSSKSQFIKETVKQEVFDQQADQVFDQMQERKQQAVELVQQFWSFIKDETLIREKGPIRKNLEKEIVNKLLNFASEMNNDPNESEGSGSVAVITLLLKTVLYLRDLNNESRYRLAELEKKLNKLSSASGYHHVE